MLLQFPCYQRPLFHGICPLNTKENWDTSASRKCFYVLQTSIKQVFVPVANEMRWLSAKWKNNMHFMTTTLKRKCFPAITNPLNFDYNNWKLTFVNWSVSETVKALMVQVYVVVWFNLSLNFNFLCFKTHYHKLPYMKAKENNSLNQG